MEFLHKPVLYEESILGLNIQPNGIYVDGTVGGGGHSSGIVEKLDKNGTLICIDQDEEALRVAKEKIESANTKDARLIFVKSNFRKISEIVREKDLPGLDGILLDIGVSSYQLDNPVRGFSYNYDAPLDMRMDRNSGLTAYEIVNFWSKVKIKETIAAFGEERWADRIAAFIEKRRQEKPINSTFELVDIIKAAIPAAARREGPHPAKRTFQAIRIAVNDELGVLDGVLQDGMNVLNCKGRFCIITFHSLEDRIVKNGFAKMAHPCECPSSFPQCVCGKKQQARIISRKPISPSAEELERNPRARSAKLRVAEKI